MTTMNRREAIAAMGASAAAALSGRPAVGSAAEPTAEPKFAVRSPLVGKTLRERAELAARCGYTGIEIGGGEWFEPSVKEILASIQGTGVAISAVSALQKHLDLDPQVRKTCLEENRQRLAKARDVGATAMVVVTVFGQASRFPDLSPVLTPREIETKLMVHTLSALAPTAEKTGVKLILEPLTKKESHFINRQVEGLELIRQVDSPAVGLLSDFYHMQMEETDVPAALRACNDKIYYVHVADGEARTPAGTLPYDYRPGFAVLKEIGYTGWITSEAQTSGDIPRSLRNALEYLKTQWRQA